MSVLNSPWVSDNEILQKLFHIWVPVSPEKYSYCTVISALEAMNDMAWRFCMTEVEVHYYYHHRWNSNKTK